MSGRRDLAIAGALPPIAAAAAAVLYDDPLPMLLVVVAAGVAAAVPVGLARDRPSVAGPVAGSALAAILLVIVLTADGGAGPGTALRELGGSLAHLLSFAPPIATRADTLTPPVIVVWASSFLAATAVARGRRLLAAAPAAVVLIGALLLVGASAPVPAWVAPGVARGTAALLLAPAAGRGRRSGHRPHRSRRPTGGTVTGAVAAVSLVAAGLLAAQAVPDARRFDARARYQPPLEQVQPIDPLTRLAGWARGDREPLVTLAVDATTPGGRTPRTAWRWAVLDRFDGTRWTSSSRYRPTGRRLRSSPDVEDATTSASSRLVRAAVHVSPTLAPWLPTPGPVLRVRGPEVRVNADHDSLESSFPGSSYSLVAGAVPNSENPDDRARIAGFTAGTSGTRWPRSPCLACRSSCARSPSRSDPPPGRRTASAPWACRTCCGTTGSSLPTPRRGICT